MKTTAEMKLEITNGRIAGAKIMPDGTCKLEIEISTSKGEDFSREDYLKFPFSKNDDPDADCN